MGDVSNVADLRTAYAAVRGGDLTIMKLTSLTTVAGFFYSTWTMAGGIGGTGATPGAVTVCTKLTTGALGRWPNNTTGVNRLFGSHISCYTAGAFCPILYDRLVHQGGLVTNVATSQTTNLPITLSGVSTGRYDSVGFSDVEWFLEVYSAGGATSSVSCTVTYTNQSGTGSRTAVIPLAASGWPLGRVYSINAYLQDGDTGIQSIQSIILNTSSGTAGSIGITAAKRIAMLPQVEPSYSNTHERPCGAIRSNPWLTGLPVIHDDACLWFVAIAQSTSLQFYGNLAVRGMP